LCPKSRSSFLSACPFFLFSMQPWLALALPAGLAAKAALSGRRGKKAPVRQPLGGLGFDEFGER